jgi:hypothetical protein
MRGLVLPARAPRHFRVINHQSSIPSTQPPVPSPCLADFGLRTPDVPCRPSSLLLGFLFPIACHLFPCLPARHSSLLQALSFTLLGRILTLSLMLCISPDGRAHRQSGDSCATRRKAFGDNWNRP